MEIYYRREMKHNYLVIEPENRGNWGYECRMLAGNTIDGILRFRIRQVDDKPFFYYEITSRQPLSNLLASRYITLKEMEQLIFQISAVVNRIEPYLLRENQILLDPAYIYVEPSAFAVSLCMVPGYECDFSQSLTKLLQYMMEKVDHRDKECVVLAYGLYHESLKENYSIYNLMELMSHPEREELPGKSPEPEPERGMEEEPDILPLPSRTIERGISADVRRFWFLPFVLLWSAGPGLLWLFFGTLGFTRYWIWLLAGEVAATAALSAYFVLGRRRDVVKAGQPEQEEAGRKTKEQKGELEAWRVRFQELEDPPEAVKPEVSEPVESREGNTILLHTGKSDKTVLCVLRGLVKDLPDIEITYFPFMIGKNESLADYAIARDTVSRLHLRVDKKDQTFTVTDLNSTNGTAVSGRILDANESAPVEDGDMVQIADLKYQFLSPEKERGGP